mmetsp:Transcript_106377/g.237463  ORF Transcript_106377/g.237463 Transcript_106377/m.237463 type:complete len:83 (-) Transcript_106377:1010-1258(-)
MRSQGRIGLPEGHPIEHDDPGVPISCGGFHVVLVAAECRDWPPKALHVQCNPITGDIGVKIEEQKGDATKARRRGKAVRINP